MRYRPMYDDNDDVKSETEKDEASYAEEAWHTRILNYRKKEDGLNARREASDSMKFA